VEGDPESLQGLCTHLSQPRSQSNIPASPGSSKVHPLKTKTNRKKKKESKGVGNEKLIRSNSKCSCLLRKSLLHNYRPDKGPSGIFHSRENTTEKK
jgi:hypothetical protein